MKNKKLHLSKISIEDLQLTFDLINEKTVRRWAFNPSKIKYKIHEKWLKKKFKKKEFYFWKLVKKTECLGLVRIELIKEKYELSYLISKKFRGKNLGLQMINLAIKKIYKKKSKIKNIFAKSFIKNVSSNKTLLKSGFKLFRKNKNTNYYVYKK